jgi:predicted lipid-binding transport protein (Tim44 family)
VVSAIAKASLNFFSERERICARIRPYPLSANKTPPMRNAQRLSESTVNSRANPISPTRGATGGIMEIETLKAMSEGIFLELLKMMGIVGLFAGLLAIAGFAVYLAGIARLCWKETRQPALRLQQHEPAQAPESPVPAENFHREEEKLSLESIHFHNVSG